MSNKGHENPCFCCVNSLYLYANLRRLLLPAIFVASAAISLAASLFLLIGVLRGRHRQGRVTDMPSVAVIVAGRNESATIQHCLQSILALDYPPELIERYYVDDGSTDDSAAIAANIARASEGKLTVLQAPPNLDGLGPKKNALRAAIETSQAELLLFTDADAEVPKGWVRAIVRLFEPDVGAVAGLFDPIARDETNGRLYRFERLMHGVISAGCLDWGYPSSVCGANFAYRRACYEELGGFAGARMRAGDDDVMAQAISERGWLVRFAADPDSVVRDLRMPTASEFRDAKRRHQSTARAYPAVWLMFFWMVIAAQIGYLGGWIHTIFHPAFLPVVLTAFLLRYVLDYSLLRHFARIHSLREWKKGFFLAEVLLPFYLLLQPVFALGNAFEWKDRRLTVKTAETSEGQG